MFSTHGVQYSHVCGRVIGYQDGETEAFESTASFSLEGWHIYLDGVSLTFGLPRHTSGALQVQGVKPLPLILYAHVPVLGKPLTVPSFPSM